jgi:hypothetical protein
MTASESFVRAKSAPISLQMTMETTSEPWVRRIKWRFVFFFLITGTVIAIPAYAWFWSQQPDDIVVFDTYKKVSLKALSGIPFDPANGKITDIPQRYRDLEGQRVKLAGFMVAPGAQRYTNIKNFDLFYIDPNVGSANPPVQAHIHCTVQGNGVVRYLSGPATVWGFFHCDIHRDANTHEITSIYQLETYSVLPLKE